MIYLRNCWYMAGWASDLNNGPLGRSLLDQPVALFRDGDGVARAIADRCPHRFVRLSSGRVVEGTLECPYHGLRFDGLGRCAHNPRGAAPAQAKVRAYPLVERHSILWIWMGDDACADPSLIPDFSINDPDDNHVSGEYLSMECNYRFGTDNILDLSQIQFSHRDTIGPVFAGGTREESSMRQVANVVFSYRRYVGVLVKPAMARPGGPAAGTLRDMWINVRWHAPAIMLLYSGAPLEADAFFIDPSGARHTHIFTPAGRVSSHYWFGASRPKTSSTAEAVKEEVYRLRAKFTNEDAPLLVQQQEAFGDQDFWEARPIILPDDSAAIRARRVLDKLMRDEAAAPQMAWFMVDAAI